MCRAARVTIHQRQQIVINKAQLKARRTGGQARPDGRWIYFSADAKAGVRANPYLAVAERATYPRARARAPRALTTAVMSRY